MIEGPSNKEERRRDAICRYLGRQSTPDAEFDEITFAAAHICATPMACIAFADDMLCRVASNCGVPDALIPGVIAHCARIVGGFDLAGDQDTRNDAEVAEIPPAGAGSDIPFYMGVPITTPDGLRIGCLCVLDTVPRTLTLPQRRTLDTVGRQIMTLLELRRRDAHGGPTVARFDLQRLLPLTLDALTSHVCVLDQDGTIVAVNRSWERFAEENGGSAAMCGVGVNYMSVCAHSSGSYAAEAPLVEQGIRDVAGGRRREFTLEYPCNSADVQRWFIVRVTRLDWDGPLHVVIAHEDISERKRTEEELRESERRFSNLLSTTGLVSVMLDRDGHVTYCNDSLLRLTDWEHEAIIGRNWFDCFARPEIIRDYRDAFPARIDDLPDTWHHEGEIRTRSGEWRVVRWNNSLLRSVTGDVVGTASIGEDVTDRKQAEKERRESDRRFRSILNTTALVSIMLDRDATITYCNDSLLRLTGWQREDVVGRDFIECFLPAEKRERARESFASLLDDSPSVWNRENELQTRSGERRLIRWSSAVLRSADGEVVGTASIGEDITDRKRAEDELRESERRFGEILATTGLVSTILDREGRITYCNDSLLLLTGWQRDEVVGRDWFEFFLPSNLVDERRATFSTLVDGAIANWSRDVQIRTRTGDHRLLRLNSSALRSITGDVVGAATIGEDITDRHRAQEALRASEERFRTTLDNMIEGCQIIGYDWTYLYVNATACRHSRKPAEELVGSTIPSAFPAIESTEIFAALRRCMTEREVQRIESEFIYGDGSSAWFSIAVQPVPEGLFILSLDITERKRAEDELLESERRYSNILETTGLISMMLDREGRITYCNDSLLRLTGWRRDELIGRDWFESFALGDRVAERRAAFEKLIAGAPENWHADVQIRTRTGERRLLRWASSILRATTGEVVGTAHIGADVTERQEAEEALRASEERFRTTLDNLIEGCQIIGHDWTYLYMNASAGRHGRRPPEELIGRTMVEAYPGIDSTEMFAALERCLVHRVAQQIENEFRYDDGTSAWFSLAIQPVPEGLFILSLDITERKRAEQEIRWKTAFLEAQVQSSFDGILVVDGHGKKILQNHRVRDLFEIPTPIFDDDDDTAELQWVTNVVRNRQQFIERVTYLYENESEIGMDEIELKSGTVLERYSSPVLGKDGAYYGRIWTFHDVTARKHAEIENVRLASIVESTDDAVISMSIDGGTITSWNRGAESLYGYAATEVMGAPISILIPTGVDDGEVGILERIRRGESVTHYETTRMRKNGSLLDVSLTVSLLKDSGGNVIGISKIARDVTERKHAELALKRAHDELESRVVERTTDLIAATEEADRANRAKSEFLSRMSHELRTPLNAILGFGQILNKENLTDIQRESVQYVLKGGRHLLDLINEVLDIARVEAGGIEISIEPMALADIVAEACALLRPLANGRNVRLVEHPSVLGRTHVLADRQRLKQVMINLLSNAIKYNRRDGTVDISCTETSSNRIRIAVQDTGTGISAADLPKLFVPFERLGAANSDVEGTGLGLALSQRLVTAMGGSLEADSTPGLGSTFTIELPQAADVLAALERTGSAGLDQDAVLREQGSHTILNIEDNVSNHRLLEAILAARPGVTLLAAMQGSVGLDLAQQHEPDLILLDLHLPDMPGSEVLARLRQSDVTRNIPVVVISADATTGQIERLLAAGANGYLTKPLDIDEFLSLTDEILAAADDSNIGYTI